MRRQEDQWRQLCHEDGHTVCLYISFSRSVEQQSGLLQTSAACWNGFSLTATNITACGPSPSSVAALTSATRFLLVSKSTNCFAPSFFVISAFSEPPSTAIICSPIALAYWHAKLPKPPPAPTIATVWPGRAPDSLSPL